MQKLFYLRSALKGGAAFMGTSEDTLQSLVTPINNRFENKRLIVCSYILNILDIERQNIESATDLTNLMDVLSSNLKGLKVMKLEENDLNYQHLINILIQKLDKESHKMHGMSLTSTELLNWERLIGFLQKKNMHFGKSASARYVVKS